MNGGQNLNVIIQEKGTPNVKPCYLFIQFNFVFIHMREVAVCEGIKQLLVGQVRTGDTDVRTSPHEVLILLLYHLRCLLGGNADRQLDIQVCYLNN